MTQRLFRIYFSTTPHVPAHSYRHVWAENPDEAQRLVDEAIEENRAALKALDFHLGSLQEEKINLFEDFLRDLSSDTV
jgi:hypothetical protein